MPFSPSSMGNAGLTPQDVQLQTSAPAPPFRRTFENAIAVNNSIGMAFEAAKYAMESRGISTEVDPDFDPLAGDNVLGYEDVAGELVKARNQQQLNSIKSRVDRERARESELESGGFAGALTSLAVGILDPIGLIPMGGGSKAYALARTGRIAQAAMTGAKAGAAYGAGFEAVAQSTMISRTNEESLAMIGANTVFMGVLGAAGRATIEAVKAGKIAYKGRVLRSMDEVVTAMEEGSKEYANVLASRHGDSVGAARVPETTMEQETLVSALGLERRGPFAKQDPLIRLSNSTSLSARRVVEQLADTPLMRAKNQEGIASPVPVESLLAARQATLELLAPKIHDLFIQARLGRSARRGDALITGLRDLVRPPENAMTFSQFRTEVGKAMARNDAHEIPQVAEAARLYRQHVFDPLKKEAIDLGLLPPDVKPQTAASYISRLYNKERIIAERPEFERRIIGWLKKQNTNITQRFENFNKQSEIANGVIQERRPQLDQKRAELAEISPRKSDLDKQYQGLTAKLRRLKTAKARTETRKQSKETR